MLQLCNGLEGMMDSSLEYMAHTADIKQCCFCDIHWNDDDTRNTPTRRYSHEYIERQLIHQ